MSVKYEVSCTTAQRQASWLAIKGSPNQVCAVEEFHKSNMKINDVFQYNSTCDTSTDNLKISLNKQRSKLPICTVQGF